MRISQPGRFFSLLFLLGLAPAQETATAPIQIQSEVWAETVDAWSEPLIEDQIAMGFCVGILLGKNRWVRGYGLTAREDGRLPDGDTIYEIGSISKAFTGILLAEAVQRGELELDTPVQRLMPKPVVLNGKKGEVQLMHLSNHTSGWPRLPTNFEPADPLDPYADYGEELLLEYLGDFRPRRAPGKRYAYSNLAAGTLGYLLAKHQGGDYERLLKDRITSTLKMPSTMVVLPKELEGRFALPHSQDLVMVSPWRIPTLAGAGGIRSSVTDMLAFAEAVAHPEGNPLEAAIMLSQKVTHTSKDGTQLGLGWHIPPIDVGLMHNGQTGGYHSCLCIVPEEDLAVVVLSNTASAAIDQLAFNLMHELRGKETKPWAYEKAITLPREKLSEYVGEYRFTKDLTLTVALAESGLTVQLTGQTALPMHAKAVDQFFLRLVKAGVDFERNESGQVVAAILDQNGMRQRAPRIEAAPK